MLLASANGIVDRRWTESGDCRPPQRRATPQRRRRVEDDVCTPIAAPDPWRSIQGVQGRNWL